MKTKKGYPIPQGCTVAGNTVNFSVAVPAGKECELLLYKKGRKTPFTVFPVKEDSVTGELRFLSVILDKPQEYEYNYRIGDTVVLDPYGKAFVGKEVWGKRRDAQNHEIRTRIVADDFFWGEDIRPHLPMEEVIAYSLHVRGFTKHKSSKVKHKGTFCGLIEKLPYIRKLGVNQIQCMPVYEFEENQERYTNYWGYGDGCYFAPKASYAAEDAVTELKETVKTLHKEKIEIILEMPFTSGTSMLLIADCLRYWVMQYHIDGFIVNPDICDIGTLAKDPVLVHTKILKKQDQFQNTMRRFLKGDEGMIGETAWQLRRLSEGGGTFNYIASHNGFTLHDVVSYDGKHNELNGEQNHDGPEYNYSWNCGAEGPSRKKAVLDLRRGQIRNAFLLLLLAQGTPCILAGDEFENTQKGNNNVYCQDNPTAWLDWSRLEKDPSLFVFVKGLTAFRKEHRVFCPKTEMRGLDDMCCGIPDVSYHGRYAWQMPSEVASRQLGVFYHGTDGREDNCFVAYNMHWLEHIFALPKLPKELKWHEAVNTMEGVLESARPIEEKEVVVKERTIRVFVGL